MGLARIGKVRLKSGAEIVPLRAGGQIHNDRKANFINNIGASFDSFTRKYGEQPDAMVIVLGGLRQAAETFWIVRGESEGGATTMLAFAQASIQRQLLNGDD